MAKTSVDDQSSSEIIANSMRGLYSIANTLKQIAKLVAIAGLDDTMRRGFRWTENASFKPFLSGFRGLEYVFAARKEGFLRAFVLNGLAQSLESHSQDQGVVYYVMKAIVTLAYPYPPQQMLALCGSLLDIVIAIMKLFPAEARIQDEKTLKRIEKSLKRA